MRRYERLSAAELHAFIDEQIALLDPSKEVRVREQYRAVEQYLDKHGVQSAVLYEGPHVNEAQWMARRASEVHYAEERPHLVRVVLHRDGRPDYEMGRFAWLDCQLTDRGATHG